MEAPNTVGEGVSGLLRPPLCFICAPALPGFLWFCGAREVASCAQQSAIHYYIHSTYNYFFQFFSFLFFFLWFDRVTLNGQVGMVGISPNSGSDGPTGSSFFFPFPQGPLKLMGWDGYNFLLMRSNHRKGTSDAGCSGTGEAPVSGRSDLAPSGLEGEGSGRDDVQSQGFILILRFSVISFGGPTSISASFLFLL